jgi:diguanylate cyclase (GGDEF)-like protein
MKELTRTKIRNTSIILISIVSIGLIGFLDYLTGPELYFSFFYLFPIVLVIWNTKFRFLDLIFSGICVGVWLIADMFTQSGHSQPFVIIWNMIFLFAYFFIISKILVRLKNQLEAEKILATTDPLTGAMNSRFFYEIVSAEIKRHARYLSPFTIVYFDIDDFKQVNDAYGHSVGDSLLKLTVKTLNDNLRATDSIARLGGDEFSILLPETGFEQSASILEKISSVLLNASQSENYYVTFSIGATTVTKNATVTVDEVIRLSDELMYWVKNNGKNGISHREYSIQD